MPFILLTLTKAFVLSFLLSRRWTGGRRVMLWSGNLCSFPLSLSRVWGQVLEGGERIHVSASLLCLLQPLQKGGSSTDQEFGWCLWRCPSMPEQTAPGVDQAWQTRMVQLSFWVIISSVTLYQSHPPPYSPLLPSLCHQAGRQPERLQCVSAFVDPTSNGERDTVLTETITRRG